MGKVLELKMAKADKDDIRHVTDFFRMIEEITEYGTYTQAINGEEDTQSVREDDVFADLIRDKWPYVAGAWSRVVLGCDILIANCCDPSLDYLDFKPELKNLAEENERLRELAKAYEEWEADLVLNGDWSGECVRMTQAQHDRMLELQRMRNAALALTGG